LHRPINLENSIVVCNHNADPIGYDRTYKF
jgi:hypothetical protein